MSTFVVKSNNQFHVTELLDVRASYKEDSVRLHEIARRYRSELAEQNNRIFFVSFDEFNLPTAYVQLILKNADNDPELANGHEVAHVHDLRVKYELQSRSLGKNLMEHLEEESRKRGICILTLGVDNWNMRAIKFYEKLGYLKFKEIPGRTDKEVCFLMRKSI